MLAITSLPALPQDRRSLPALAWLRAIAERRRTRAELRRLLETSHHLLVDIGLDADEVATELTRSARRP